MRKRKGNLLLGCLLFLGMTPVWAGSVDMGGFEVNIEEGTLEPEPGQSEEPKQSPMPTREPADTPNAAPKPEIKPKPTKVPIMTPMPTEKPTSVPEPTKVPTVTSKPSQKPVSTPRPADKPVNTPKPTQKPESQPKLVPNQPAKTETTKIPMPTSVPMQKTAGTMEPGKSPPSVNEQNSKKGNSRTQNRNTSSNTRADRALGHSLRMVQEADFIPKILVESSYEIYVLSYRINGREVYWHWDKDWLIPENPRLRKGKNQVTLLLLENGRDIWKMKEWQFFVKSL